MSATLHVDVVGKGPPLVLLHGWAMHGGVFAPLVARLRDAYTLHVVDLPGHGRSRDCTVPLALEACVEAIAHSVPRAPWCGWSLGGLLALHAAATRPDAVPALAVPSTWLAGRRDRLVDPRAMRDAAAMAPNAMFQVVEHAGHAPFLTHADEVAMRVDGFLQGLSS